MKKLVYLFAAMLSVSCQSHRIKAVENEPDIPKVIELIKQEIPDTTEEHYYNLTFNYREMMHRSTNEGWSEWHKKDCDIYAFKNNQYAHEVILEALDYYGADAAIDRFKQDIARYKAQKDSIDKEYGKCEYCGVQCKPTTDRKQKCKDCAMKRGEFSWDTYLKY